MNPDQNRQITSLSRRRSLQAVLALLSAAGLDSAVGGTPARDEQRTRVIPSSGESIPVMGLGTARTFDVALTESSLAPLREVVRLFVDRGGKMIDSSPMYGRAEEVVGRLVSDLGVHDEIFYATKVWTRGQQAGMDQMNQSFARLRTSFIDLMQVHNLTDTATQIRNIRKLQGEGRVRYIGITHFSTGAFDELEAWMRKEKLDYVQFPYSIVDRTAEKRLLPAARDLGVATIAHRNFENGRLFSRIKGVALPHWAAEFDCASWGNFFLKYLIGEPGLTNLIPATSEARHLTDNMNAGLGRIPDAAMRARMVKFIESL
ncbi:MAG: aldo/keto reductase [Arenicellales bacterium]